MGSGGKPGLPQRDGHAHNDPAERAPHADAHGDVRLDEEEHDGRPEDDLEAVEYRVGLEAPPPAQALDVVGQELVEKEIDGFRRLREKNGIMVSVAQ